jgi:plastocyanin
MLAGISLAACQARPQVMPASAPGIGVEISASNCPNVVIAPGTYVAWTNVDEVAHIVRHVPEQGEPQFVSGPLQRGDRFELKFEEAGTFPYVCSQDGLMPRGLITVVREGEKIDVVLPAKRDQM